VRRPGRRTRAAAFLAATLGLAAPGGAPVASSGEPPPAAPPGPSPAPGAPPAPTAAPTGPTDPKDGEVVLPASGGWHASLVLDNGTTGIWTVGAYPLWESTAPLEVLGLDDKGVLQVLAPYSGRWTPFRTLSDGKWLGGLAHADVDPRVLGKEVYTGSQNGNVWQVVPHGHGPVFDTRLLAHLPGFEVHTIVAGDLDPDVAGSEVLVFTRPGRLFQATPTGEHGSFEVKDLGEVPGRVRDAILLPLREGVRGTEIACVGHAGRLEVLRVVGGVPSFETAYEGDSGVGRVAMKEGSTAASLVLYTTRDDGIVMRHARDASGRFSTETIYLGSQGPRGVAAGPFDADPTVETVAVFGYSKWVELLRRGPSGWTVERVFEDRDKGHWLASAELDGRNGTREILACGYGGRIVLLSRPPGYGRPGLAAPR
jgi:hypothetical protein